MSCCTYIKSCPSVKYKAILAINNIQINCSADSLIFATVRPYECVITSPWHTFKSFNSSRLSLKIHKLRDVIYIWKAKVDRCVLWQGYGKLTWGSGLCSGYEKEIFLLRSFQNGSGFDSIGAVGRCQGYEADWAPPLYNRRIMGGAVSTAASSCIAAGLTERQR
jgi:hypothetical protein